jgi:hypothetical protein
MRLPDDVLSIKEAREPKLLAHDAFTTAPHLVT